jgi:hypothetical protein
MRYVSPRGITLAAAKKRTSWVRQVIWVDDRVVHGVRRVDVDLTVAERVLESGGNANGAINVHPK